MKIERVNSLTFKLDGASYNTGDVIAKPDEERGRISLYLKNGSFSLPIFRDKKWDTLTDAADAAFANFAAASAYLSAAIASGDGVSSVLSDKAAVTQATSKTTTVVSNTSNTKITTVALTDAADTAFSFTFTNSKIAATSNVLPTVDMNGGTGKAVIHVTPAAGSATVTVTNVGTAAFNSAIKIGLVVL